MGYLPHTGGLSKTPHLIVVDAVLTELGRFRLAEGAGNFNITKFALGDDEIDYSLYDTSLATENQDDVIMLTPVLEAVPDSVSGIRHFLYTAPPPDQGFGTPPTINANPIALEVGEGNEGVIVVTTSNAADPDMSYSVQWSDSNAQKCFDIVGDNVLSSPQPDDLVKVWTIGATGGGNSALIRIRGLTPAQNPLTGDPLQDSDTFTFSISIRGTTTGLSPTGGNDVKWYRFKLPEV